jgi:hypothetical protein
MNTLMSRGTISVVILLLRFHWIILFTHDICHVDNTSKFTSRHSFSLLYSSQRDQATEGAFLSAAFSALDMGSFACSLMAVVVRRSEKTEAEKEAIWGMACVVLRERKTSC